jgi:hypothetical protein
MHLQSKGVSLGLGIGSLIEVKVLQLLTRLRHRTETVVAASRACLKKRRCFSSCTVVGDIETSEHCLRRKINQCAQRRRSKIAARAAFAPKSAGPFAQRRCTHGLAYRSVFESGLGLRKGLARTQTCRCQRCQCRISGHGESRNALNRH